MNKYIFAYTVKNEGNPNSYLDVNNATINYITTTTRTAAMPNGRNDYSLIITYGGIVKLTEKDGDKYLDSHCIIYKPFQPHNYTYVATPDSEIYCLHFKGTFVEFILDELHLNSNYYFKIEKSPAMAQIVKQLIILLQSKGTNYKTKCNYNFLNLLSLLSESAISNDTTPTAKGTKIQPAVDAILHDASRYKTLEELAALCNMPKPTFIKLFPLIMGEAPIAYLNRKKLENSIFFLLESDFNINEIALTVGFENQFYYSNRFKKAYGMSPFQYRKKYTKLSYFTDEK